MHRTPSKALLLVAAFALFLVPVAAIAAAGFTDVADDNVFVADIEWMKDNGITKGCNPPTNDRFCPGNNVTREQMSAFMHRLAVSQVVDAATAVEADNADRLDGKDSTGFAASGHDHDAEYLAKTGKAADTDKLDGSSVESIVPRAAGAYYTRGPGEPSEWEASVTIDAPARGVIVAHAGGDTWGGTSTQSCALWVDEMDFMGGRGVVDHAQGDEADCIVSGSLVVDAGVHTVDLLLKGDAEHHDGALWAMWVPFDGTGAIPTSVYLGSVAPGGDYQG